MIRLTPQEHVLLGRLGSDRIGIEELQALGELTRGHARVVAHRLCRAGRLVRLRQGLYSAEGVGPGGGLAVASLYPGRCFVGFASAAAHHGLQPREPEMLQLVAPDHPRRIVLAGVRCRVLGVPERRFFGGSPVRASAVEVSVATLERTLLDAVDRPRWLGGLARVSELLGAASARLDWHRMSDYLARWDLPALSQRLGYLLEARRISMPPAVREELLTRAAEGGNLHLGPRREFGTRGTVDRRWGIIENVPRSLLEAPEPAPERDGDLDVHLL